MKKHYRKILSFGLLSFLVVGLVVLLTGCGPLMEDATAKISVEVDDNNPLKYTFDGSASEPTDADLEYDWDFLNDGTDSGESVTYTYNSAGTYEVKLTVTKESTTTSDSTTVEIEPGIVADFEVEGVSTLDVTFDASASRSASGDIEEYSWDFDDGTSVNTSSSTVANSYSNTGDFDVELTIEDEYGNSDLVEKTLELQTDSATLS